jgi:2-oxoglutarate ferredoxin oxidoreductase subunit delta
MATKLNAKGFFYASLDKPPLCIGCRMCAIICPDSAVEVFVEGTQYEFFYY